MEYRKPLDERQLRQALLHLQSLKDYVRLIERSFPPRNALERRSWRRVRRSVEKYAAGARARDVGQMNRWAQQADAETVDYWRRRRSK